MRHIILVGALIVAACGAREDTTQIRLTEADLHEFIVMAGLLETGQSDLALERFSRLEIGDDNRALEQLAMEPERETIALTQQETLPETTVRPVRRQYDGFLDYTLFGLGGVALQNGDRTSLETIITLLQLQREVTNTEILFNNCRRALLADVLIELRDETLSSDEIFDRWQAGTADNAICDYAGSGGQVVFWRLFDPNYSTVIQSQIVERLQQSGMDVEVYSGRDVCLSLHAINGLGDVLGDLEFRTDETLTSLRDTMMQCSGIEPFEAFQAHLERHSGPSLDELVAQNLLPEDLADFLVEISIARPRASCEEGFASEDPACAGQVMLLAHDARSDRWVIDVRDPTGTHSLTIGETDTGYEILSRFFLHPYF